MLKKRLYLKRFFPSQQLFRLFANYSTIFWTTTSRLFITEPAFCKRDKNHKFDNFKTHRISFLMKSRFILSDYCIA